MSYEDSLCFIITEKVDVFYFLIQFFFWIFLEKIFSFLQILFSIRIEYVRMRTSESKRQRGRRERNMCLCVCLCMCAWVRACAFLPPYPFGEKFSSLCTFNYSSGNKASVNWYLIWYIGGRILNLSFFCNVIMYKMSVVLLYTLIVFSNWKLSLLSKFEVYDVSHFFSIEILLCLLDLHLKIIIVFLTATCPADLENCTKTAGHCIKEANEETKCVCPNSANYISGIGCESE